MVVGFDKGLKDLREKGVLLHFSKSTAGIFNPASACQ
jgi:hypothetical protein